MVPPPTGVAGSDVPALVVKAGGEFRGSFLTLCHPQCSHGAADSGVHNGVRQPQSYLYRAEQSRVKAVRIGLESAFEDSQCEGSVFRPTDDNL
jgi:hypothetical protein